MQAERLVQRITLAASAICIVLIMIKGSVMDMRAYASAVSTGALLIVVGLFYRHSGRDSKIGATAICAGWFILFTLSLSLFNYLLMPHWAAPLDPFLVSIDYLLFGYHWAEFVEASAQHPLFYEATRYAYLSTLPQIAILVAVLGLSGRLSEMSGLTTTVTLAGTATVVIWGFFPSLGPSTLQDLSPELLATAPPVVGPGYGREIARLYRQGSEFLSPDEIRGLIAFPSFHIVLALAATWYCRGIRWLFPPFFLVNLLVLPGVLVHGGHHAIDIPAGLLVFAAAAALSRRVLANVEHTTPSTAMASQLT